MGLEDSMRRAGDEVAGRAKEMWGDLTDNERLEAEGMTYAICYFPEIAYDTSGLELFEKEVIPEFR